jgi:hypothetical protein
MSGLIGDPLWVVAGWMISNPVALLGANATVLTLVPPVSL